MANSSNHLFKQFSNSTLIRIAHKSFLLPACGLESCRNRRGTLSQLFQSSHTEPKAMLLVLHGNSMNGDGWPVIWPAQSSRAKQFTFMIVSPGTMAPGPRPGTRARPGSGPGPEPKAQGPRARGRGAWARSSGPGSGRGPGPGPGPGAWSRCSGPGRGPGPGSRGPGLGPGARVGAHGAHHRYYLHHRRKAN